MSERKGQSKFRKFIGDMKAPALLFGSIMGITILLAAPQLIVEHQANNAEYLIRVSYTGLENMFHDRYEYYAVEGDKVHNVSSYASRLPDTTNLEEFDKYEDDTTNYWYMAGLENSRSTKYDVSNWTRISREQTDEEHEAHSKMLDTYGLPIDSGIMLVNHNNYYIAETREAVYKCDDLENARLVKLMDVPESGNIDCYIFISDGK